MKSNSLLCLIYTPYIHVDNFSRNIKNDQKIKRNKDEEEEEKEKHIYCTFYTKKRKF